MSVALAQAPVAHRFDPTCDCLRVTDSNGERKIPRDEIGAVEQAVTNDQHTVTLSLKEGESIVVMTQAPCAPARVLAQNYSQFLRVPLVGSGAEELCDSDLLAAVQLYEQQKIRVVESLQVPLVGLVATGRGDAPDLELQRVLAGSRAWLAQCYTVAGTLSEPRTSRFRLVARKGEIVRLKQKQGTGQASLDQCLRERLEEAKLEPGLSARVLLDVTSP